MMVGTTERMSTRKLGGTLANRQQGQIHYLLRSGESHGYPHLRHRDCRGSRVTDLGASLAICIIETSFA